ncbi:MAG: DNA topoisomerase 3 [Legionellaceae bacterium]
MKLFLCEKPSQARDIANVLGNTKKSEHYLTGNDFIVTWCYGHLLEMKSPEDYNALYKRWSLDTLPIIPEKWAMLPVEKTKKQFQAIKTLLKTTEHVVIATDADREGELIARELLTYCGYRGTIERLWLSALDEKSIQKALNAIMPGDKTEALYAAGLGRQRADWLMGMNLTRAATCSFGSFGQKPLSVGRVQTPTLRLIVDRDRKIEDFKAIDYFVLLAEFNTAKNERFWAKWECPKNELNEEGYCVNKAIVESFFDKIAGKPATVIEFSDKPAQKAPPLCFSLSALQKQASASFGFSAKKTLDIAQSLYETHKAITYPRTDCGYLPVSQQSDVSNILSMLSTLHKDYKEIVSLCDSQSRSPVWNDSKVTAHHGIIPTHNPNVSIDKMSSDQKAVYDLIVRFYLAQFLGNYHYQSRQVTVDCCGERFMAKSHTPVNLGWKKAIKQKAEEEEKEESDDNIGFLPSLSIKESLTEINHRIEAKKTKPPSYFTEGTLIDAMKNIGKWVTDPVLKKVLKETAGIGTEATRASMIELLINREYVYRQGKQLRSSEKGRHLIDVLPFAVKEPALTARWEQALDDVSQGSLPLSQFLETQEVHLREVLTILQKSPKQPMTTASIPIESSPSCPLCQQAMKKRNGKKGDFWGCGQFPTCKGTLSLEEKAPKKTSKKNTNTSKTLACPNCTTGYLVKRKGPTGEFWGCSTFPRCRAIFKDKKSEPNLKKTMSVRYGN